MKKPVIGEPVRVIDPFDDEWHTCTVIALLSTQFTCKYEYPKGDGGWAEKQLFIFYTDDWKEAS